MTPEDILAHRASGGEEFVAFEVPGGAKRLLGPALGDGAGSPPHSLFQYLRRICSLEPGRPSHPGYRVDDKSNAHATTLLEGR